MSTFDDLMLSKRSTMTLGPFESEASRIAHDLKSLPQEETLAGFRRPFRDDREGIADVLEEMGPMGRDTPTAIHGRADINDALPAPDSFRAELGMPVEMMTDEGLTSAQGELIIVDLNTNEVHRLPLDTSTSRTTIPGLGEVQRTHTLTGGAKVLEIVDSNGRTRMMPIEEDELYSSFMEGGDVDLTYAMNGTKNGYLGDVSYDTLHNIHAGAVGKKIREDASRAATVNMSETERMTFEDEPEMTAGSMESPYETSTDFMDGMDKIEDDDAELLEMLDETSQLEDFELQQVHDGLEMSRFMLEQYGHRPASEYSIELTGRTFDAGLRRYVFEVGHPQMGMYEFSYTPDLPDISNRMQIEPKTT